MGVRKAYPCVFLGLITQEEADLLREAEQHRLDTINVDDFEPELLAAKPLYSIKDNYGHESDIKKPKLRFRLS